MSRWFDGSSSQGPVGMMRYPLFRSAVAIALIDSWMPSRDPRIVLAGAVALQQLDLQQVERLDIGQAQPDRGVERRVASRAAATGR